MKSLKLAFAALVLINLSSCKKESKTPETPEETPVTPTTDLKKDILVDVSSNVINASYSDLAAKSTVLYNSAVALKGTTNATNLAAAKTAWKDLRTVWESTEGFLFGPVEVDNIDPRIDTWPIDFARLDSVMASSEVFTDSYINGLEESLKGFHPVEYLLFGQNGTKTEADFTGRQTDLLVALTNNIKILCTNVKASWDPATADNYTVKFTTAGTGNATYATQRAAYEELIDAMAGICDEVANGKISEPFDAKDPSLEESPFAKNSIVDFTNNIKSVQNVYLGKYMADGKGLEDLIKANNIAMDGTIKTKLNNAITALNNVTVPFGQAISDGAGGQRTQVQNAINAINELEVYLSGDVKAYVKTLVVN